MRYRAQEAADVFNFHGTSWVYDYGTTKAWNLLNPRATGWNASPAHVLQGGTRAGEAKVLGVGQSHYKGGFHAEVFT